MTPLDGRELSKGFMLNGLINYIPAIKYGNLVDNAELNPAISQAVQVNITAAQLNAINTTPVTLITTTAAGQLIIPQSVIFEMNATSTTFTSGGALSVTYNAGSTNLMGGTIPASVVTSSSAGYYQVDVSGNGQTVTPNAGLTLYGGTNFATGTGTAKVFLNYYIITI